MIQRVQSLYFFMASLSMGILTASPLYSTEAGGKKFTVFVGGLLQSIEGKEEVINPQPAIFAVNMLLAFMPIVAVFLFKSRKLQLRISSSAMLSFTAFVILLAAVINENIKLIEGYTGEGSYSWGLSLPFVAVIFLFLGSRAIRKDENLIRSVDRLR
ncbi:MAG: DUF4293 domain-containing protein [Bacteroidia bacterium]